MVKFSKHDFFEYRSICAALKQLQSELLNIKNRCTEVVVVDDYQTGFPKPVRIESLLVSKYRRQAAATEAAVLELEQRRDIIYRTITSACGEIDMRMYVNLVLYIIKGYSMDRVAMENNCDQSTVSRDITRFFKEGKHFYNRVINGIERKEETQYEQC